jgi:uncharacterized protein
MYCNKPLLLLLILMLGISSYFLMDVMSSAEKSLPLLAVQQSDNETRGSIADLTLEIKKGTGKIFIDSYPLTKIDTQMSTRFATLMACEFTNKNCKDYDFYYTIRAESSIIGGPSAGAAVAVLTSSMLNGDKIRSDTSITGTINSGYIIGTVGGIKDKITVASQKEINYVLIPFGDTLLQIDNETENLIEYGKSINVTVIESMTLHDALSFFTQKNYSRKENQIIIDKEYNDIMRDLSLLLCNRSIYLTDLLLSYRSIKGSNLSIENERINNLSQRGIIAFEKGSYYSSASFCFGANIQLRNKINEEWNLSKSVVINQADRIYKDIIDFEQELDEKKLITITDLQTYMIVKERIQESKDSIIEAYKLISEDKDYLYSLSYAEERIYSAYAWSYFFNSKSKEYNFNTHSLKDSCIRKLSEADESYRYVQAFFPFGLSDTRKTYEKAFADFNSGDYSMCLFRASKAKAESNTILSSLGHDDESLNLLIDIKLKIIGDAISSQAINERFPIVGYSYYEYAQSLKDNDPYSSLLFAEYALEIGNLDLYFTKEDKKSLKYYFSFNYQKFFYLGFFIGISIVIIFLLLFKKENKIVIKYRSIEKLKKEPISSSIIKKIPTKKKSIKKNRVNKIN